MFAVWEEENHPFLGMNFPIVKKMIYGSNLPGIIVL